MKTQIALVLALMLASPSNAQQTTLTGDQVRANSAALLSAGRPAEAAAFADIILAVNPDDVDALVLRARAALDMGDFANAATLAKRAYRATSNENAKFITARLAARAHAEAREDTFAQLWLRRARQFAPDEENAALVARDYRFLANRNPWSTSLRFGISPSSNVNNGSVNERVPLFGAVSQDGEELLFTLSGDALALSGLEIFAGVSTRYRLDLNEKSATFFDVDVQARTYLLSNEAQELAPDAKGSDYSDASLSFGLTHRRILSEGARPTTFSARLGQTWYGGDPLSRTAEISTAHDWVVGERHLVGIELLAQQRESLRDDEPVRTYGITTSWTQSLDNGDSLRLSLGFRDAQSDAVNSDYEGVRASSSYNLADPLAGMLLGFGLTLEERNFDASTYKPGPRKDRNLSVRMSAQFTEYEFYGFQPVASIEATRNASTVELFEREYVNFGFNLQSSF